MVWRRRKSVVNARQQIWFGLELVALSIGFIILCAFLLFMPPMSDLFDDRGMSPQVLEGLILILSLKWPMVIVGMIVLLMIGILVSHRLSGPLFGLERVIVAWTQGDRSARVRFRKYDYLLPVMVPLNNFLEREQALIQRTQTLAEEIVRDSTQESVKQKANELLTLINASGEAAVK